VLLPLFTACILLAGLLVYLASVTGTTPVAEVGAWYAIAATVYLFLPLTVFFALGMVFLPTNDGRLFAMQPDPADVARIGWMYVVHIASFCVAYVITRGMKRASHRHYERTSRRTLTLAVTLSIGLTVVLLVMRLMLPKPESYTGSYAAVAALPLGIRQALKFMNGVNFVLTIVILVTGFQQYKRWRGLIVLWLGFQFAIMLVDGSRTPLVFSFCACVLLYHAMVKPIRARRATILAVGGLVTFLALGVLRSYRGSESGSDFLFGLSGGEFEALFANAVDIDRRRSTNDIEGAPPGAYLADLVAPIPSQLLPFEKVDLADWYVSRFYPVAKEEGQGFAFGVIAQSLVGYGWWELALRGFLLGVLFAKLHSFYRRHSHRLWAIVFYVWLTVNAYQSFRSTSLSLWSSFVQQFIPALIIVEGLGAVFWQASRLRGRRNVQTVAPSFH
jgi:oligosaccharide repeat unit polymerase